MRLQDFAYDLPPDRIASEPATPRDAARLLVARHSGLEDRVVADLPDLLEPDDLVVINDTRVRAARLYGRRATGGRAEFLLLRREPGGAYHALVRANKRLRPGERIETDGDLVATLLERPDGGAIWRVGFEGGGDFCGDAENLEALLERVGHVPLPPYIKRPDVPRDKARYQTVYAREGGSAAAPTAGLHFTPELLKRLDPVAVTLHVGYGTFQPIDCERVEDHVMHEEEFEVTEKAAERIRSCKGRIVAVGTTTTRVLETLHRTGGVRAARGRTKLFLYPGRELEVVDVLLTNFHVPQSSLLLLVAAFIGLDRLKSAYAHALERNYRFFSYGDAMLAFR